MEAVALGQVAADQAVAIIGAVAQVERHDHAVQQADDAAQRTHPDEGAGAAPAHGFGPRKAAQQAGHFRTRSARRRTPRRRTCPAPSSRRPGASCSRSGVMLAQKASQRLLRRVGARAAFGGRRRRQPRPRRRPASAMRRGPEHVAMLAGVMARERCRRSAALKLRRRAALHAGGDFLAEQFQEEFGHVQSFSAGSMSVWAKSLPLNSRAPGEFGQRIGEAVAIVQPRRMIAAPVSPRGRPGQR